jgi:hypothetical protein
VTSTNSKDFSWKKWFKFAKFREKNIQIARLLQ